MGTKTAQCQAEGENKEKLMKNECEGVPVEARTSSKKSHCNMQTDKQYIAGIAEGTFDADFNERANMMRRECHAERTDHGQHQEPKNDKNQQMLFNDRPINVMPSISSVNEGEWQFLSLAVDSGAAETVIPHLMVQSHPIRETDASRSGLNYVSATGDPIPNLGDQ
mgnify:FL=1